MYAPFESSARGFAVVPDQVPLVEWDARLGVPRIVPADLEHDVRARASGRGRAVEAAPVVTWMPSRAKSRWRRLLGFLGLDRGEVQA